METQRPANRFGKIVCAALLTIGLGAGIMISAPVTDTAANLLMEDSSLGGSRGQAGLKTPTPTPDSCGSQDDSAETKSESDEQDEPSARLIP